MVEFWRQSEHEGRRERVFPATSTHLEMSERALRTLIRR